MVAAGEQGPKARVAALGDLGNQFVDGIGGSREGRKSDNRRSEGLRVDHGGVSEFVVALKKSGSSLRQLSVELVEFSGFGHQGIEGNVERAWSNGLRGIDRVCSKSSRRRDGCRCKRFDADGRCSWRSWFVRSIVAVETNFGGVVLFGTFGVGNLGSLFGRSL